MRCNSKNDADFNCALVNPIFNLPSAALSPKYALDKLVDTAVRSWPVPADTFNAVSNKLCALATSLVAVIRR